MTIQEALDRVDMLRPNRQPREMKIGWLSNLDGMIHKELILNHEHEEDLDTFAGYDRDTGDGTVLIVPDPYAEEVYTWWLAQKVDLQNLEIDKYNNDKTLFAAAYETFSDYWTRTHMPKQITRELRI